ncbi:white collar 2 type of transcription factor [Zalaria obscura]|uniref:White collar 2 type of transcription factor n=1 Tax=Zalaria obscura TaxID=2024903 RepID=A0ACC3S876_9PEZI
MSDMLGQGSGMLDGLDMNLLPMDLDLDPQLADPSAFTNSNSGGQDNTSTPGDGYLSQQNSGNNNMTSGVGAGPLPTSFGVAPPANNSTLTEFTKRRNWSQRVIEEIKDFLHILTQDGRILYVSPSCKIITGYEPVQLVGKFIGEFVHPEDSGIFMREFNESIASGNALRFFYRFKKEDGTYMIFECDGHPHVTSDVSAAGAYNGMAMSVANTPTASGFCHGFFMMARPYPTKISILLDSFLEHKIENERLLKRIEELKREEAEENEAQERHWQAQSESGRQDGQSQSRAADGTSEAASTPNYQGMPPPAKPSISNTALTRQNLDNVLSQQRPDSIADKMSRYEGSNHLETIEMLTGLRYRDGERSHGISTGDTSPALIRGDAGIAILVDRDREGSKEKKKKLKVADEYVCADCGTLDSPEWRKGPKGPKTLCNACGLRWAKKEKKRQGTDHGSGQSGGGAGTGGMIPQAGMTPTHTPGLQHQNSSGSG